jgi:hypothetical protein
MLQNNASKTVLRIMARKMALIAVSGNSIILTVTVSRKLI